jgi:ATP-binding cassette subfamily B protein
MGFPYYKQLDAMDCGPSCLRMIARYYGKNYSLENLRERCFLSRAGVSLLGISDAAESIGFRTIGVTIGYEQLTDEIPLPCIVHWKQNHFVVVYKIKKNKPFFGKSSETIYVADPGLDTVRYTKEEFIKEWQSTRIDGEEKGIALLLEPSPDFYNIADEQTDKTRLSYLFSYLKPYRKYITQLVLGMLLGSLLQLIFPFLTQSIVDKGIASHNLGFITLVLIAQLVLLVSRISVEFIRSWILLHISSRINISLISDFLIKLMKLPIGYFDTKMIGDILQRIGDHTRIESFLTGSSLSTLFSLINLIVFGAVLAYFDISIFGIFIVGTLLYIAWIFLFLRKRRELDFKRFAKASENQSNLIQLITGMQEIKLNNCEKQKRWKWERIQAGLFHISMKSLALGQYQKIGSFFFNQTTNIFITFIAARAVVNGQMTLGMMMAVIYIIGQISSPIEQLISFIQSWQDAKISLERLGEIHLKQDEETSATPHVSIIPEKTDIVINKMSFRYEGPNSPNVLTNINICIPAGKITAIVGASGSGKTTLVKLLLGFYKPNEGDIKVGEINLHNFNSHSWRARCGAVMQDGFIFSESIAQNIATGEEIIDRDRLFNAVKIANIQEFVESLPLGYNTKVGQEGSGISQGQKQRLLIARAVYKDPEYIFFDEATNALDANNEKVIMQNLSEFFKGKTVVVVAHRLSTVKNADQIIVIDKGNIIEIGNHQLLTEKRGAYYELVKNQLELGS